MADPEARAVARQHTARLLKMLRGYESVSESEVAHPAPSGSVAVAVAEATPAYARRLETAPDRSPPITPSPSSLPPPQQAAPPAPIPTVGETLRRQKGVLGQLMVQADQFTQSNRIFQAYLPPHLRDHAVLVRMDQDGWEVQTDSASWATRLRYALHSIRQALGQHLGISLPKPRIKIVPADLPPLPRRPRLTLSESSARLLEATAHNLGNTRLSTALLRLAEHGRPTLK